MTMLFDRLRGRNGAPAVIDGAHWNETLPESDSTPGSDASKVQQSSAAEPSPTIHLRDTMPSETSDKPMSFHYAPGSMPLAPYRIRRGVGIGGFGEVYFAVSEAGKEVALKRVQRNLDVELRGVSHCLNLKHPNLVALYDICRDAEDQAWVVMEYVAGPSLRQVLDDAPNGLPEADVQRWFDGIAAGVRHLHSAGLVHRDIKPGNVFDDVGIVKVGDYGLSKFISTSHRGGHTESVGTFHYMAPEIGRGQYGREIDIYALGIVLFEMLTGRVPFDGESCHEIIVKHLTATADLSGIAEPYRTAIERALHKDPAQRPGTIDEFVGLLRGHSSIIVPAGAVTHAASSEPYVMGIDVELRSVTSQPAATRDATARANNVHPASVQNGTLVAAPSGNDEPLARAIRHSLQDLRRWWAALDRSPGAKLFLGIAAAFVLLVNTHWLLPVLSLLGVFYVPYYIIRHMVLHATQQPSYAQAQRVAATSGHAFRPANRQQWRKMMRDDLRAKHSVSRLAELSTSYIAGTLTTVILGLITGVIAMRSGPVNPQTIAPYFWIASVVLVATYALLGLGKLWERGEGEGLTRRVALAGVGAGIGAFAFALLQFFMLPGDVGLVREIDSTVLPQALYFESGAPRASAWMAHFALLFAGLRWWKPVDPLRRRRLSLWSVAVAVVAEWMVHQLLPIPQPGGMLLVGGLAIAIQMSAPWVNPVPITISSRVQPLAPNRQLAGGKT